MLRTSSRLFSGAFRAPLSTTNACLAKPFFRPTARLLDVDVKVPSIGETVTSVKIGEFYVKEGDYVQAEAPIFVVESDKVTTDVPAPKAGVLKKILHDSGASLGIGDVVAIIDDAAPAPAGSAKPEAPKAAAKAEAPKATEAPAAKAAPAAAAAPARAAAPAITIEGSVRTQKISTLRHRVAERLKASQNTLALLTTFNEIDMSKAMALRESKQDEFVKRHGVKLGFMSIFAKACATALMKNPIINSQWDAANDQIVTPNYVDISVAVAGPRGLVVPVVRDVHLMGFADVRAPRSGASLRVCIHGASASTTSSDKSITPCPYLNPIRT